MVTCKSCNIKKDNSNFYIKDKLTGRLSGKCKICEAKHRGIKDIGKLSISQKNWINGKRKCCDCKTLKPIIDFVKNKSVKSGYSSVCYACSKERVYKYRRESNKELGSHYLKRFAISNYGVKHEDATGEILEIAKLHVEAKRNMKLILDGLEFSTMQHFAKYVNEKYGISEHCVKKRLYMGHTENDCTIPEFEFRSQFSCKSRGKVLVTDINTGTARIFSSPKRIVDEINISVDVVNRCLSTGEIRKPYKNSKNKQTLKIEYYAD